MVMDIGVTDLIVAILIIVIMFLLLCIDFNPLKRSSLYTDVIPVRIGALEDLAIQRSNINYTQVYNVITQAVNVACKYGSFYVKINVFRYNIFEQVNMNDVIQRLISAGFKVNMVSHYIIIDWSESMNSAHYHSLQHKIDINNQITTVINEKVNNCLDRNESSCIIKLSEIYLKTQMDKYIHNKNIDIDNIVTLEKIGDLYIKNGYKYKILPSAFNNHTNEYVMDEVQLVLYWNNAEV